MSTSKHDWLVWGVVMTGMAVSIAVGLYLSTR